MDVEGEYTDAFLWNLFVQGDKSALEILYKRHYDLLFNYGLKYYACEYLVKDCIQDLFVKLYMAKNIKATPFVIAYLIKSLRNILFDKVNENKTIPITDHLITFDLSIQDSTLEKLFVKNDRDLVISKKLVQSFSKLSQNQKQILYLRYVKDLSHKEIAAIMDINEQSAMNLLSRTLSKLRKVISF